jgi:hypothetical protein
MRVSARDQAAQALLSTDSTTTGSDRHAPSPSSSQGGASLFARMLHGIGREVTTGEAAMRTAVAAIGARSDLGPAQLIALQAGVYRYSEAIDLASRLVDRATGSVKTVVQAGGQ